MNGKELFRRHESSLEDFWGRRENGPRFVKRTALLNRPLEVSSNEEALLEAVDISLLLFSTAAVTVTAPFTVHLVVRRSTVDPGAPPENLLAVNTYTGYEAWLSIQLGAWGHCQVDTAAGRAIAVLSPQLAQRPELVSQALLNTIFTNFLIGSGYGMLHCTSLWRNGRVLLLVAPHNSGKSTTALYLVMAGYHLIADSQIYLAPNDERLQLFGFPVGRTKLRHDMLPAFPQLSTFLVAEPVRHETKYSLDLRKVDSRLVCSRAVVPELIDLCLLERRDGSETTLQPASEAAVWDALMHNSIFYDEFPAWERNLAALKPLVEQARAYHLRIGTNPSAMTSVIDKLLLEGLA